MEQVAKIGRVSLNLTQEMGRMLLFVLSSFAWLTRPPLRVYGRAAPVQRSQQAALARR